MAFRRWALEEVGGFDPTYTKAGDDVDICWRLQERGWRLAFSPSALVWHHHRNSVGAYWRQQVGYGEGESFLEHRHQEKFNERGQTRWQGRIYSHLPAYRSLFKSVIYHGRWGVAAAMFVATLWRCFAHAWQTKLDDAPTADSPSARLKHRLLIAWLHYIQLWARFRGRVKGYFSSG